MKNQKNTNNYAKRKAEKAETLKRKNQRKGKNARVNLYTDMH